MRDAYHVSLISIAIVCLFVRLSFIVSRGDTDITVQPMSGIFRFLLRSFLLSVLS